MIRGASLLKDTESGASVAETDELRAELIKQKILFEAELRRQREVSDERFDTMNRQLLNVIDDNTQLRRTLHALGDRLAIAEHQQAHILANQRAASRSISPVIINHRGVASSSANRKQIHQQQQQQQQNHGADGEEQLEVAADNHNHQKASRKSTQRDGRISAPRTPVRTTSNGPSSSHLPRTAQPPRQASPVPNILHIQGANHQFVKIRSSPTPTPSQSANQTPRTTTTAITPRGGQQVGVTRTSSNVSVNNNQAGATTATSPAHIQFRPVLRSNTNTSSSSHHHHHHHHNENKTSSSGPNSQNTSGIVFMNDSGNNNNSQQQQQSAAIGSNSSLIRPFRSPMRQSDVEKIGKQQVSHSGRWR